MRKELLWAAVIGITFGVVIAFGVWRISSNKTQPGKTESTPTPTPVIGEVKTTMDRPEDGDVVDSNLITVSGITKPLSWVTVSGEKGDYTVQAAENGVFNQEIDLAAGINQIKISTFDAIGNHDVQKLTIVYSSVFEPASVPSPTPGNNSTESAIRQKVEEKVAQVLNKPKAYMGVVTDIADSTIELKGTDSQIKQVSTSKDNITVVNEKGTSNKVVKLSDIAIGDFIVALGYVNSKSVLSAQRILIIDPLTDLKVDAFYAKVTDTSKTALTVNNMPDGTEASLSPDSKSDIETFKDGKFVLSKLSGINQGDILVYVLDSSGKIVVVRSVFIVQQNLEPALDL